MAGNSPCHLQVNGPEKARHKEEKKKTPITVHVILQHRIQRWFAEMRPIESGFILEKQKSCTLWICYNKRGCLDCKITAFFSECDSTKWWCCAEKARAYRDTSQGGLTGYNNSRLHTYDSDLTLVHVTDREAIYHMKKSFLWKPVAPIPQYPK